MWPSRKKYKEHIITKIKKRQNKINVLENKLRDERDTIAIGITKIKINKIREEIKKMAKLALRNGKLEKVEETPQQVAPVEQPKQIIDGVPIEPQMEQPEFDNQNAPIDINPFEIPQQLQQQMQPPQPQPQPQPQPRPQAPRKL